jgi:hypothetical protein
VIKVFTNKKLFQNRLFLQARCVWTGCASAGKRKISYNAGDYVCNFSMYVILDYARRHTGEIAQLGFVHIPHRYDPKKATRFVRKVLNQLRMGDHAPR